MKTKANIQKIDHPLIAGGLDARTSSVWKFTCPLMLATALAVSLCAHAQSTVTLNFDSLTHGTTGAAMEDYLATFGISISAMTPGTHIGAYDYRLVYGGGAVVPSSGHMFLTQGGNNSGETFTLNFSPPLTRLSFTRITWLPGQFGAALPDWSATVFQEATVIGSVGQSAHSIWSPTTDPAQTYTFDGSAITSIQFDSNGHNFAAWSGPAIDDLVLTRSLADIVATSFAWDSDNGGVKFNLTVSGGDLPTPPQVSLYWASGSEFQDVLGGPACTVFLSGITAAGDYGPFNLQASDLGEPPVGATHLSLYVDPPMSGFPEGLLQESDEANNIQAMWDVQLAFGANANRETITPYTDQVLKRLLRYSGEASALITSTYRSAHDQARAMYDDLESPPATPYKHGKKVIDEYDRLKSASATRDETIAGMEAVIVDIGAEKISHHCGDYQRLGVVDIAPSSIQNATRFIATVSAERAINHFRCPWCKAYDADAYHVEIPQ